MMMNRGNQFCDGSIIDEYHILTAAHCVAQMRASDVTTLTVRMGAHNLRNNEQQQEYEFTKDLQNAKQKLGTSIRTEETEINAENAQNAFLDAMKSVKQTFDQSKEEVGVDQAIDLIKSQWDRDEDEEESDENLDLQGEFE